MPKGFMPKKLKLATYTNDRMKLPNLIHTSQLPIINSKKELVILIQLPVSVILIHKTAYNKPRELVILIKMQHLDNLYTTYQ